jgi:SAM-dependent methyltransferase
MNRTDLVKAYQDRLATYGPGPQAVQYADHASHIARFEILAAIDPGMESVLDVGCGLGDFCHYLRARGSTADYLGIDLVPEFVAHAQTAFADDPLSSVMLGDATAELPRGRDYAILSGVFNNLMDDNWGFMTTTLRRMYAAARRGIAFNAMTSHVDYRDPELFYVDPMQVFAFCKAELGGHPVLRHDYVTRPGGFPYEFAIYVYKSPRAPQVA